MPGRALGEQVGALERGVGDAEVGHRSGWSARRPSSRTQVARDRGAAHAREALDLLVVGDRHDPRDDRDVDADVARAGDELPVDRVVEEQLRDQEARAGVDLLLAVAQVALRRLGVDVHLGEAGGADREVVLVADQLDQLAAVLEAALGRRPLGLAGRRVAAQREDVLGCPASRIRSSVSRSSSAVAPTQVKWAIASRPCSALIEETMSTVLRFWSVRAAGAVGHRHERRAACGAARPARGRGCARPRRSWAGRTRTRTRARRPSASRSSMRMRAQSRPRPTTARGSRPRIRPARAAPGGSGRRASC